MQTILLQLDVDPQPSSFDAVVATDAGAQTLLQHGGVELEQVQDLVYGLMFTRHPDQLNSSAIFIGGRDVVRAEAILDQVRKTFFGPFHVSVMLDPNGANTTAAAAVVLAGTHVDLSQAKATVLGGTGPVGRRVGRLLTGLGASVTLVSRSKDRAQSTVDRIAATEPIGSIEAAQATTIDHVRDAIDGRSVIVAAGTTGVELVPQPLWREVKPSLVIDLNAVPPLGVGGIQVDDAAADYDGTAVYGAIGVGNFKMKIHHAAIRQLFTRNDLVLDAEQLAELGRSLTA